MKELFNKKTIYIFLGVVVLFAVIYGITEFEIYKTKISEQEKQITDLLQEKDEGKIVDSIDKDPEEEIIPENLEIKLERSVKKSSSETA